MITENRMKSIRYILFLLIIGVSVFAMNVEAHAASTAPRRAAVRLNQVDEREDTKVYLTAQELVVEASFRGIVVEVFDITGKECCRALSTQSFVVRIPRGELPQAPAILLLRITNAKNNHSKTIKVTL